MQDIVESNSMVRMVWEAVPAFHFDFIMFIIALLMYAVLHFSRQSHMAKEFHKKVDTISEESSEVVNDDTEADRLSVSSAGSAQWVESKGDTVQFAHVLKRMENDEDAGQSAAEMDAFLESNPNHPLTFSDVQTILNFCSRSKALPTLADRLLEFIQPAEEWDVLNAFVCFYIDNDMAEKACNVFELNYATFFDVELDEHTEWQLLMAALQCGRQSLAELLLQTSQSNAAKRVVTIQKWWRNTSAKMGEARIAHMGDVLNRLSNMFNDRYPFEEHSDDESTCFLGDDDNYGSSSDADSDWEDLK